MSSHLACHMSYVLSSHLSPVFCSLNPHLALNSCVTCQVTCHISCHLPVSTCPAGPRWWRCGTMVRWGPGLLPWSKRWSYRNHKWYSMNKLVVNGQSFTININKYKWFCKSEVDLLMTSLLVTCWLDPEWTCQRSPRHARPGRSPASGPGTRRTGRDDINKELFEKCTHKCWFSMLQDIP